MMKRVGVVRTKGIRGFFIYMSRDATFRRYLPQLSKYGTNTIASTRWALRTADSITRNVMDRLTYYDYS